MPELDDTVVAATAAAANDATTGDVHASAGRAAPSRRSMLRVAAGAGAAGVAATTLGGMVGKMAARANSRPWPSHLRLPAPNRSSCTFATHHQARSTCFAARRRPVCRTVTSPRTSSA